MKKIVVIIMALAMVMCFAACGDSGASDEGQAEPAAEPNAGIEGIVFTMYDSRTKLATQVVENVEQNTDKKIYKAVIPRNVRLAEAPSYGMPIIEYDPRSTGAKAYDVLAKKVIRYHYKRAKR